MANFTQIPLDQRALINTAGQILSKSGSYRDALMMFIEQNKDEEAKQSLYIDQQLQIVEHACNEGVKKRISRVVTHQRKVVQITMELHWIQDRSVSDSVGNSPWILLWSIVGTDLQEIFRFLPKMLNPNGLLSVPKRGTKHSRWYPLKENRENFKQIALELRMLQIYISLSELSVRQRVMIRGSADDVKDAVGILDLDVEVNTQILRNFDKTTGTRFVELISAFKKNRGNPQKRAHGIYLYNKNGTSIDVLDQLFETTDNDNGIQKIPGIYIHHINILKDFSNKDNVENHLHRMMTGNYVIGMMSVSNHTMFWVKDNHTWYLCDPWKKKFLPGHEAHKICNNMFDAVIKQINYQSAKHPDAKNNTHDGDDMINFAERAAINTSHVSWMFLARQCNEQYKTERSCALATLSRVIQFSIDVQGTDTFDIRINKPITDWAAMLSSCMIRKMQTRIISKKR